MRKLDPPLWKARVFSRFHRASPTRARSAARRLVYDLSAVDAMARVVEWCERNDIEVVFVRRLTGRYTPGRASVGAHLSPERQLFVLLHECGHHVLSERAPEARFRRGYAERDPRFLRTNVHRVDVVHEELEAWHEGSELARRLGLVLDIDRYNKVRAEYVFSYLKWALRGPGYEGDLADGDEQGAQRRAARRGTDVRTGRPLRGRHRAHGKDGTRHASGPQPART